MYSVLEGIGGGTLSIYAWRSNLSCSYFEDFLFSPRDWSACRVSFLIIILLGGEGGRLCGVESGEIKVMIKIMSRRGGLGGVGACHALQLPVVDFVGAIPL